MAWPCSFEDYSSSSGGNRRVNNAGVHSGVELDQVRMLVKTRFQNGLSGLVSLRCSIGEFDMSGLQIITRQRVGVYRLESVSTTRVTLSDPSASVSNDDVVREVLVHGDTNNGQVGSRSQGNRSSEIGGRV